MSSLDPSTENGTPSNDTPSLTMISYEIAHRVNIPTRSRKSTSAAWNAIKRIKNNANVSTEHEGMTYLRIKRGATLRCTKDKNGMCRTARALEHRKKLLIRIITTQ